MRPLLHSHLHRIVIHREHRKVNFSPTQLRRWRRQPITGLVRRGKRLAIQTPLGSLVVGAGMSGHWRWTPATAGFVPAKHDIFSLETNVGTATYNDARRFGSARIFGPGDLSWATGVGLEGSDRRIMADAAAVRAAFARCPGRPIKVALLDQHRIAGLGNIYAAEVLWHLKVDPSCTVADFKPWPLLGIAVHRVLSAAIRGRGTRIAGANPYRTPGNEKTNGYAVAVYGRTGQPCYRCNHPIQQFTQAGRTTFHCDHCQH